MRIYSLLDITKLNANKLRLGAKEEEILQIIRDLADEVLTLKAEVQSNKIKLAVLIQEKLA